MLTDFLLAGAPQGAGRTALTLRHTSFQMISERCLRHAAGLPWLPQSTIETPVKTDRRP